MSSVVLCEYCKVIAVACSSSSSQTQPMQWIRYGRQDCYPELPALAASASSGCPVCRVMIHEIHRLAKPPQIPPEPRVISIAKVCLVRENLYHDGIPGIENGVFRLIVDLSAPRMGGWSATFEVYADEDSEAATQGKIRRRIPSCDPLSARNVQTVKGLIRECYEHHNGCRIDGLRSLPKRLLDVDTGDEFQTRLVETVKLSPASLYAALSHTWGQILASGSFLTTNVNSIEDRLRAMPLSTMPQNFQDAVKVARTLGVRYLWIDSLCIIQDSQTDWAAEASRMDQIYANAYITIVATSAASANEGFLTRPPLLYPPVKVPYPSTGNESSPSFFYLCARLVGPFRNDRKELIESTIWNSRGWTFQERLLSKRLLHFTKLMLHFECRVHDWMEDNRPEDNGPQTLYNSHTVRPGSDVSVFGYVPRNTLSERELGYRSWYCLIQDYSARNLTKAMDKLPAMAGLARVMANLVHDQYVAGLWKNDLIRGLFWNIEPYRNTQKSNVYRAPSWSWAQFDGRITFTGAMPLLGNIRYCCNILDVEVEGVAGDRMGLSRSGWLKLRGRLESVSGVESVYTQVARDPRPHRIFSNAGLVGEGHLDQGISIIGPGLFAFLLRIDFVEGEDHLVPRCLLLKATGTDLNEYSRVGTMSIVTKATEGRLDFFDTSTEHTIVVV